jgi:hypothetical protein
MSRCTRFRLMERFCFSLSHSVIWRLATIECTHAIGSWERREDDRGLSVGARSINRSHGSRPAADWSGRAPIVVVEQAADPFASIDDRRVLLCLAAATGA